MKPFDWSKPQKQPWAGLAVVFANTLWEAIKGLWVFILLILLKRKDESGPDWTQILAIIILFLTVVSALFRFLFFRFYIEEGKLVIKKGWLKKETKVIPLERIQTVHVEQGPLHQLLSIVKLSIDTAGTQKTEATIEALGKPMAEALREELLSVQGQENKEAVNNSIPGAPSITLTDRDLLKLSISANHLEAFFIVFSFMFGLYDRLRSIDDDLVSGVDNLFPDKAIYPVLFLIAAVLMVTLLVSTARVFLRFYNFAVFRVNNGFRIRGGLFNVKEKLIASRKVQYVSWRANWIRKLMRLWMLEYHVSGGYEIKSKQRVHLPITRPAYLPMLVADYYPIPATGGLLSIRVHPSFIGRRLLMFGVLPTLIILPLMWWAWGAYSLFFLLYTPVPGFAALLIQKKFRLWALDDVLLVKRGFFGETHILLQWQKIQAVSIRQSIYQRQKGLASVKLDTAAGSIYIPYINLKAARELTDYALYKASSRYASWL
ncbi:MAG TPA: PH domain-containing protein [Flavisolibacter sp.]|nr:PH domain-containing protein [Flavisolibacter sp.]